MPSPCGIGVCHLPGPSLYSTARKCYWAWCPEVLLGFIMVAWLIESLAMWIDSVSSLLPLPRIGLPQSPTPLIAWLVLLVISPQSESSHFTWSQVWLKGLMNNQDPSVTREVPRIYSLPFRNQGPRPFRFFIAQGGDYIWVSEIQGGGLGREPSPCLGVAPLILCLSGWVYGYAVACD